MQFLDSNGNPLGFLTEPARQKDDEADQQDQAEPSSADGGPSNVKAAAPEQQKEDDEEKHEVHVSKIALLRTHRYGAFTPTFPVRC